MLKTVWITGITGQLGCELTKLFTQCSAFNFIGNYQNTLDITRKEDIIRFLQKHSIDYIIHCAAYTQVDQAEEERKLCYAVNYEAVKNLVEANQEKAKILYISTDYVFDGETSTPYTESDYTRPLSVYGKSKLDGEVILMTDCPQSIIIRTSWLYSSFGNNFVKTMFYLLKKQTNLPVVCDQIGTPTYAADLAQVILSILLHWDKINPSCSGVFHYSNESRASWFDFAQKIAELFDVQTCEIYPVFTEDYPSKAKRPKYSVLDKAKIKEMFGLVIPSWETSLEKCVEILKETISQSISL